MAAAAGSESDLPSLLIAYAFVWGLQQAAPFANVILGITGGAIDNRPLSSWDWRLRLPMLAALAWRAPHGDLRGLLLLAHAVNLGFWVASLPFVWDHMCWAALTELSLVLSMLIGGDEQTIAHRFFAAARAQTAVLYFSAAFWKLTSSFLNPQTSCGTLLAAELASLFPESVLPEDSAAAQALLLGAPALTVLGEFSIPLLLMLRPRLGVLLGLGFHLTVILLPVNAAGGFSIMCASRYIFFVPESATQALADLARSPRQQAAFALALAVAFRLLRGTADATFAIYLFLMLLYAAARAEHAAGHRRVLTWIMVAVTAAYGFLGPVLGVQNMGSLSMYANLKHYGGTNHLVVPTAVLPHLDDLVRIDGTDSPELNRLSPADATQLLPPRVRRLLARVGASGRYFGQYYMRMSTSDFLDGLEGSSSHGIPYALPAFELRRLLAVAGHGFQVRFTRLPAAARTPGAWLAHRGPEVLVNSSGCFVGGEACGADELALLEPKPSWLAVFLLPYPVPLLPGDDVDIHCSA